MNIIYYTNQDSNIKVSLKHSGLIITMPGCGYCEQLKPVLKDLDDKLKFYNDDGITKIYNIENKAFDKILTNSKIKAAVSSGYPTILTVKNNNVLQIYDGSRTADDLLNFFIRNLKIKKVKNIKNVKKGGTQKKHKKLRKHKKSRRHKNSRRHT
jgi:hypothetical protein